MVRYKIQREKAGRSELPFEYYRYTLADDIKPLFGRMVFLGDVSVFWNNATNTTLPNRPRVSIKKT